MNIPRLVIADERREGKVPPSVLVAAALKNMGYPLRIFCAGPDEYLSRLTKLVTGENVTILDPFSCGNNRVFKTLFQNSAEENSLNIILAPLGVKKDDEGFAVSPQTPGLCKLLECPLVPIIYADSSAAVASRALEGVLNGLASQGEVFTPVILFASVLNAREYQLLEIEAGRKAPVVSLGYIPQMLERESSTLLELSLGNMADRAVFPIKAAATLLLGLSGQVDWNVLWAVAKLNQSWTNVSEPFKGKAAGLTVGVITHAGLDLEGNNARCLFSYLGCSVRKIFLEENRPALDVDAVYAPHGPGFLCAELLLGNTGAKEWFKGLFKSRKVVFVNGGVAPLLGESFSLPNGKEYEGMNLFRYRGNYGMPSSDVRKVEISSIEGDILLNLGERMRGYITPYASIVNSEDGADSRWNLKDAQNGKDIGLSGWNIGYGIVTEACVELWSNMEGIYRWLVLRKH